MNWNDCLIYEVEVLNQAVSTRGLMHRKNWSELIKVLEIGDIGDSDNGLKASVVGFRNRKLGSGREGRRVFKAN